MEAPTSASLGAMGSLLRKLHVLLASGCRLPEKVKDGVHLLKDDLEEISGCLQDLSEVEDPPLTAKCWMKEVRELSYDIEDYIDKLVRPVRANIKTRFVCKISHVKITRLPKRLKWHQQIANTISEFRIYVQEAIERHERYELHCCTFRRRFVSVGPMLPTPYEETAELVIDGRMNEFMNSLANDGDQQLKVVSIVGPECLGKTTLAKMLYNKFGGQFDCRAFIRVSQKPDTKRLLCDMLSQVQRQPPPDDCKELDLIDNIRKHLQDKRYLIIIDDLWAASVWDIINHAFPEGSRRSRIITTTQIEDVALTCCCYRSEDIFEMKPLDDDHSRKLFFNRLFGSESDCPQQFKEISNKTVEICGGLPLATVQIASLLESQPVILLELWMYVCDSLSSDLRTNSTSNRMRQALTLSFNNLPHHLKTCLLYLNMYPKGHTICKDDLVKQWVAEGFIDRIEGRDMEKVAGCYFDELIDRRFIQPINVNYNDEVLSCTVHDMVHDLIAYKSVEKNFIVVVDYYRKNVEISDKVRRLSLYFGNAKYAKTPANIRTSQVRSLTFFGLFKCMPSITEFKLLRVLNLQLFGHHGDDMLDLTGISELFQLRYLKIAGNICIELPNRMQGLQYLETLDMDTKVTAIPWDIIYIPRLLHLHLPVETNLVDWIGSMRSFSEQSLGNLTNLQDLHLTCSTPPSDHLQRSMEALGSLLEVLGNLKTLTLVPCYSHKNVVARNASEVIIYWVYLAPPFLQRFEWLPQSCIFSRVPKWIGELGSLCILKIAVRELLRNGVDILKGLPALTALSLYVQTAPVERIVFDKAGFSVLKYFKFKCSVPWLKFEAGAMPNLRKLMLGFNALGADQHGTKPISIEHLPGLKEISAKIGVAGSDADSALAIAVSNHPRNPRINVQGRSMMTKEKEHRTLEEQDEILEEDPDKHYKTQDGESREDENKQAGSMARQVQEHGTLVDQDEIMEDDPDEDSGEDENKQTGRRISTLPESSSHLPIPEDPHTCLMDSETKELYFRSRTQEEEILLLRKQIADASLKELQLLSEKHILERKLSDLRMAVDEKQEDAISGALKQLSQKKNHLEENMRLANELKVEEEELYLFTSSLLGILAEYNVRPPQINASTITTCTKRLYQQMQWRIRSLNGKDVVAAIRTPQDLDAMKECMPEPYAELVENYKILESHYKEMMDSLGDIAQPGDIYNPNHQQATPSRNEPSSSYNMDGNRNTLRQYGQDPNDRHAEQLYNGSTFHKDNSNYFEENAGPRDVRLDGDSQFYRHDNQEYSADGDLSPGIEEFQIVGEPIPGLTLTACGFPSNGTTLCTFQWVRYLENGIRQSIEGATMYDYVVTADDVGTVLSVDCTPMDDNGRQGELVREFANNQNKITCDPEMQNDIDMCISRGSADFDVSVLQGYSDDEWVQAILLLRRTGYQIKFKHTDKVVIEEKYSSHLQTKIPNGRTTQFVLVSSGGVNLPFNTQGITGPNNEDNDVRLRDLIVLVIRTFQNKAFDAKRKGKA